MPRIFDNTSNTSSETQKIVQKTIRPQNDTDSFCVTSLLSLPLNTRSLELIEGRKDLI